MGRPTKYEEGYCAIALAACRDGATNAKLAKIFKVNIDTIKEWLNVHPEFSASVRAGKYEYDTERVEVAAKERAVGYSHPEEKIFYDSKRGEEVRVGTTRHYPPDTQALIFWLINRAPERWAKQSLSALGSGAGGPGGSGEPTPETIVLEVMPKPDK